MIFRPGTVDRDCWNGIVGGNEYNLPDRLPTHDLIVDIGTHVGSFVQACWNRGARNILSIEADPDNYAIAQENVGNLEGVILMHGAVGRNDERWQPFVYFGGYERFFDGRVNTGAGNTFAKSDDGVKVPCWPFDTILPSHDISLLKIDCEGSEWPILYTSQMMHRVKRICGEYHSVSPAIEADLDLPYLCSEGGLQNFLCDHGFSYVEVQPFNEMHAQYNNGQKIGLFFASR